MTEVTSYQSAVEIVTAYVAGLIRSDLAAKVGGGELNFEFLRDLSRAKLVEPLRAALNDDNSLVERVAGQLKVLVPLAPSNREAAAAAVLLVRISKPIISQPQGTEIHELALELQKSIPESAEEYLKVELALQLACNQDAREQAVDLLLKEPGAVESVREHYLEAASPSELLERVRERWKSQSLADVTASEERLGGLSPFFHFCPAPGGSSEAVVLTGLFAKALASAADDRVAGMVSWLKQAALSQRVIQWEFFERHQSGGYSSKASDLPTLVAADFLADLTAEWWSYVARFEPIPIGMPIRRDEPKELPNHLKESAENSLAVFRLILASLQTMAPVNAHQKVAAQMAQEWQSSGRAGTLLIHDGELTYWALRWLIGNRDEEGQWCLPFPVGTKFDWRPADFPRILEFLGLGFAAGQTVILTPRWRSFVHWSALVADLDLGTLPLNVSSLSNIINVCNSVERKIEAGDDPVINSRAPFLPLETFLRAYRPWPSQLLVTTVHAQRREGAIMPLSFGFATVVGDLPFVTHREWFPREPEGEAVEGEAKGRRLFLSWLNNHCTLLSGVGMSLGVSSEMALAALLDESEAFFNLVWGKTAVWFANNDSQPQHLWDEARLPPPDGVASSWSIVLDHLETITGKGSDFWGVPDQDLWEELKRLFGIKARCQSPTGGYALTLGGVWIIALAFARKIFGVDVESESFTTNDSLRTEAVLYHEVGFEGHREVVVKLLTVFRELFIRVDGGDCTVQAIRRVPGELQFDLDLPFYKRSETGERPFWSALLGKSGGARDAIAGLHRALREAGSPTWPAADVLVKPIGPAFNESMRLVIRRGGN